MHDIRNRSGSQPVFQSGCSRGPAISISAPSDDWCIVGSRTPSAMIHRRHFSTTGLVRAAKRLSHGIPICSARSRNAGDSSIHSTHM